MQLVRKEFINLWRQIFLITFMTSNSTNNLRLKIVPLTRFLQRVMNFEVFTSKLKAELEKPLPGLQAQLKMSSCKRIVELFIKEPINPTQSSVLILLYPNDGNIWFVITLRPDYDGIHSGQISLPGGKFEISDQSLSQTALREAKEEIGIDPDSVKILAPLTHLYIPPSNFLVSPFIGYTESRPVFKADPTEVAKIIEIKLSDLKNPDNIRSRKITLKMGINIRVPCWEINGNIIWGATAMILSEFRELLLRNNNPIL